METGLFKKRWFPGTLGLPDRLPKDIRLLSLDIFDTALRRIYCQPAHIFCLTERRLAEQGLPVRGFAGIREKAERLSRQTAWHAHGKAETTFESIYAHIETLTGLPVSILETAKRLEIAAEQESTRADPAVLDLFRQASLMGLPVVFVSDMYFPRVVIADLLATQGYAGYLELFLSSEWFLNKSDGSLLRAVLDTFELNSDRVLHIGDNSHADAAMPMKLGMRHARYGHGREALGKFRPLSPDGLTLSRLKAKHWPSGLSQTDAGEFFKYLGRTYGPLIHGSFVQWIAQEVMANQTDLVLFFSRDGYLLKKIYDMFRSRGAPLPPSAYCCVSRAALCMPRIYDLDENAYSFLLSGMEERTAGQFLRRCGIKLEPAFEAAILASHGLHAEDTVNRDRTALERMRQVMRRLETPLRLEASRQRVNLETYLSRFDLNRFKRLAVVDLGWGGSLQAAFEPTIRGMGFSGELRGYYLALVGKVQALRAAGHRLFGFLENHVSSWDDPARLDMRHVVPLGAIVLLELLHAAPHGGVCGYESRFGTVRPCFADNPVEKRQYAENLAFYQEAVLQEMAGRGFEDGDFSREACQNAITDLCRYPSPPEAAVLGNLIHFDGIEHVGEGTVIAPAMALDADSGLTREAFNKAFWKSGFLVRNQRQCDAAGLSTAGDGWPVDPPVQSGQAGLDAPVSRPLLGQSAARAILVLTHDLSCSGAPLLLLHWLRWLTLHTDWSIRIIHIWGGQLRKDFAEIAPLRSYYEDIAPPGVPWEEQVERLAAFCGGRVDAVLGNTAFCAETYDLIASLGAPIVTYVHELEHVLYRFVGQDRLKQMLKHTAHYVAGDAKVKDTLLARFALESSNIDVVDAFFAPSIELSRLGAKDALRLELGLPGDVPVILGCGNIEWRKGPDLFIEVAKRVRRLIDAPVCFCWMGREFPEEKNSELLLAADDPENPVLFIGERKNYKDYFFACDVFLLTAREGYASLAAMEAYECGSPVICFNGVANMAAFITSDIGVMVDYEDTQAMARALADLLADPAGLKAMGLAGRRKALATHVVDQAAPLLLASLLPVMMASVPETYVSEGMCKRGETGATPPTIYSTNRAIKDSAHER